MRRCFGLSMVRQWLLPPVVLLIAAMGPAVAAVCKGEDGGGSVVTSINAGDTLILEDGRAVRLSGVIGPRRAQGGPAQEARAKMEAAIAELTVGKKVSLQLGDRKRDRYGRILAQVMVSSAGGGDPAWVQEQLIAAGLARVISFEDNRLCIKDLLAAEDDARRTAKGFWQTGLFAVRAAEAEDVLYRLEQNYEIVEGQVSNVAEIKGKTYINFGRNWRRDFTAFIPAQSVKLFAAGDGGQGNSSVLGALGGKRIRVRGWMKNYNGPSITVTHPEQIEILDNSTAAIR